MNQSTMNTVFYIPEDISKIRYDKPPFPSLYFPLKRSKTPTGTATTRSFSTSYLYYVSDIWEFTILWCLILYPSAYIISGIITLYNLLHVHKRIFTKQKKDTDSSSSGDDFSTSDNSSSDNVKLNSSTTNNGIYYLLLLIYLLLYPTIGLVYGAIYGTVMGFLLGIIYRSGLFGMSTWVPLCVSCCSLLYTILSSYKLFGYAM